MKSVPHGFDPAFQIAPMEFLATLDTKSQLSVEAPSTMAANIAVVNGMPTIFLANFTGLVLHKIAVPTPLTTARISIPVADHRTLPVLPFLGEAQTVPGQRIGDRLVFSLPTLERGAITRSEDTESIH